MKPPENITTIEQMEADNAMLKQNACAVCAETYDDRVKAQSPHCKFGEGGICCKNCSMGPCRITAKAPRGICGADAHAIAARNYLRSVAAGTSSHSDHAREILHVLRNASPEGNYKIRDEQKLLSLAKEWEVPTEGRDIYDIARDVADIGLMEFGKPEGTQRFVSRATPERQKVWAEQGILPRAIDREVVTAMHMTHMGNTADAEFLVRQGLRTSIANGWGGSMLGTEVTDILFGTPTVRTTEGNLGVLEKDMVNIVVHGHDPVFSEMVVTAAEVKELTDYAKTKGAKGINIVGLCCTANEVAMRHGVRMAGNFLQQENAILTGVVEMMCVDIQCIFPALPQLAECFHTKFVTSSPIARIPGATHIEFKPETAFQQAKDIVKMAVDNYQNREASKVCIPPSKKNAVVGYPTEQIIKHLDGVTNSHVDELGSYKPAIDAIKAGVLRGAVAIVGCNNPRVRPDYSHFEIMKELLQNDILIVATGCAAQVATKAGLLNYDAKYYCGAGLRRVCELVHIPPILHMGACVDISRMMLLATGIAKDWGVDTTQIPVVGCAPEWMSEKAVSIANYVVSTGLDVYLGIEPQVSGSAQMMELITEGTRKITGAGYIINTDPHELVKNILAGIEAKRTALGI
ncbi:anaerobic carbon-monoxide dehydrogenase catalytic subunit [Leadbettera azotonutricia]|uniref:Carbon monoxide dehydrogenase n=2 Tax=Leadbettera azotonutricia (strain ATCC BAA-888 / DSM 13862 / ZAS-9) TaxID=545695 RepID=F5YDA7_LEAAZ|nr:anaerobic carbon-monoxide dehydrogenase catalytic subunit [Leadbettera azotonutricia]AEF82508.1 carbon-monoxide dehydrogenase, catalytic subunit [Leadbettera azotonutricia ZAS-9]